MSSNETVRSTSSHEVAPFRAFVRGLPLIVLTVLITAGAAVLLSFTQTEKYRATAEAIVSADAAQNSVGNAPQLSSDPARVVATQARIARLPEVAKAALEDADVDQSTAEFLSNSSVTADLDADVLEFVVDTEDPEAARALADAYVAAYVSYRGRSDSESARKARQAIETRIDELEATGELTESELLDLVNKAERLRALELERMSASVPGAPAGPADKVQPQPLRNGLLGVVLGVVLGIGLIYARSSLKTTITTVAQVEAALDLPLLGRIPTPPRSLAPFTVASLENPMADESEPYRMLATSIEVANLTHAATSFIVVSALPGEGKSTTAANLAVAFARRGEDVVLVEADLRRPVMRRYFDLDPGPGFGEVVLGTATPEEALAEVPLPSGPEEADDALGQGRLRVLAASSIQVPADELLQSEAAHELIRLLSNDAGMVLIDSPPLLQVSDARTLILSEFIDCALIAVRLGKVHIPELREVRRLLGGAPVFPLGFFATDVQRDENYAGSYGYSPALASKSRGTKG